ncbi:TPA: hypothetical protein L1189_003839 [Escherichia coli]|nr:hypothetical protein [Escherichia coli]HBN1775109.1 hypothetical protein [Escherichia coli]HBN1812668.1 hypothetical protein [Escherichia coli]HBN1933270.1 hypothetical protein [Escherichia coli]HBN2068101.1 hypothetical protein [Escherichia coli]
MMMIRRLPLRWFLSVFSVSVHFVVYGHHQRKNKHYQAEQRHACNATHNKMLYQQVKN